MRTALIGMQLAQALHLATADRFALFYALLLKDLGCSSNAAKMSYLFGADDHLVKRSVRMLDWTKPAECLKHAWCNSAPGGSVFDKFLQMAALMRGGPKAAREIAEIRCQRGADIARMLMLPEATALAILDLDEHWNGKGNSRGLNGEAISLLGRICCLAQTVEVFFTAFGAPAAIDVAQQRRGQWFDPQLVDTLLALHRKPDFWQRLVSQDLMAELRHFEPEDAILSADEACLDRIALAFAKVVDAKSPWTYQHSTHVAEIAVGMSREFGCTPDLERDIRRAALLHDIGKLGVSNRILDKPGKLTDEENVQMQKHPDYSLQILRQVDAFKVLADAASAHHERLDGMGYHRRLGGDQIPWVGRLLAVADICEALSAKRPYRDALPWERIHEIISKNIGSGLDPQCVAAVERWQDRHELVSRVEVQICEVNRLLSAV